MYAIYLQKYLEGRISHSPNSQINAPVSYYIDHLSLVVRVTLKLRRESNVNLPYDPPVSPWSAAVKERCCCCVLYLPHEMLPKSAVLNLTPGEEYRWRTPQLMVGPRGWKGAKMSALLAQKDTYLRVPGNFSTGTMMVPQNRDTRCVRVLSTANSNLVLRFCLNSI